MGPASAGRRSTLALVAAALLAPAVARAQDPRASMVQKAARDWLELADRLDALASWEAAGPRFREAIAAPRWAEGLRVQREPRGALVQRSVASTSFGSSFRGLPEGGTYALVRFRTSFANRPVNDEDVTLERNAEGVWQVIGYVIS